VGGERIEIVLAEGADIEPARTLLQQLAAGEVVVDERARRFVVPVRDGSRVLIEALRRLDALGTPVVDISLRRPTLDDVFLTLTGHAAEGDAAATQRAGARG
jgi:ABC-2 type transport system ATP-binding protein